MWVKRRVYWIAGITFTLIFFLILAVANFHALVERDQLINILTEKVEAWGLWEFKIQFSFDYPILIAIGSPFLVLGCICLLFANNELKSSNKPKPGSKLLLFSFVAGTFVWTLSFSLFAEAFVVAPCVVVLYYMIAPMFWFIIWIGHLSEKRSTMIWEVFRWAFTTFIVTFGSTFLSLLAHPLISLALVVITLPGFVGLILNLIAWDLARRGESAFRLAIVGGVLTLINPFSLLVITTIPSILCIVGGVQSK